MTLFQINIDNMLRLYNRFSKLKPSALMQEERSEQSETRDIVNISSEGKKKQIMDQARKEVLERIKST
ncbi:MAG: hypothetical protein M0Z67_03700 [Nitrospiraceae bacterium]|nr:hypothetical protein [Nitrospiraceae bacterium]